MYDQETLTKIMEVLGDEQKTLQEIVTLEERRCNLLADNQFQDLESVDEAMGTLVEKLNGLEKERLYTSSQGGRGHSMERLSELIAAVPQEIRSQLLQIQHSINAVVQRLQFLKSVTRAMLRDKQELIERTLAAAAGEIPEKEYTENGEIRPTGSGSVLVNKSI